MIYRAEVVRYPVRFLLSCDRGEIHFASSMADQASSARNARLPDEEISTNKGAMLKTMAPACTEGLAYCHS